MNPYAAYKQTTKHSMTRIDLILALYRKEALNLDQLMALALSDDHDKQKAAWENVPKHGRDADSLRRALTENEISIGAAIVKRSKTKIQWPCFILLFCLAAVASTYLPALTNFWHVLSNLGRLGLTATLYLIGTGISRATLRQVGWPPLLQGVILWILVGVTSLWLIFAGWISL